MFFARADDPDQIGMLLDRAQLLAEAREARQVMERGGMLFFDDDPAKACRLREAAIWAHNQTDPQITAAADSALFVADMLDPGDVDSEDLTFAEDLLDDDADLV